MKLRRFASSSQINPSFFHNPKSKITQLLFSLPTAAELPQLFHLSSTRIHLSSTRIQLTMPPKTKNPNVYTSKKKKKATKEGESSRREESPPPPANQTRKRMRLRLREAASQEQQIEPDEEMQAPNSPDPYALKVIDFNAPLEIPEFGLACYSRLEDLKMLPTPYPDERVCKYFGIHVEVKELLSACGLSILYESNPGTSKRFSLEFLSTFRPTYFDGFGNEIEVRDDWDREHRLKHRVARWYFYMGGEQWELTRGMISEWLRFPIDGEVEKSSQKVRDEFWRMLVGQHEYYVSHQTANRIVKGTWRIIHRIVGEGFSARLDGPRFVTEDDIDLLIMISQKREVDWIGVLTDLFLEHQNAVISVGGLAGGSFISILGIELGYNVLDDEKRKGKNLGFTALRAAKILDKKDEWKIEKYPSARVANAMEARAIEDKEDPPVWPRPWAKPDDPAKKEDDMPHYASRILSRFEANDRKQAALSSYLTEVNSCYEHNFARIFEKMDLGEPRRATPFTWPMGFDDAGPSSRPQGNDGDRGEEDE